MQSSSEKTTQTPPRLIPSLVTGFNIVANNIHLILLPVLFDIILWLGPHIGLKKTFLPGINEFTTTMSKLAPVEMQSMLDASRQLWEQVLSQFNLVSVMRTFPVGLPSLIARILPIQTPFGDAQIFELNSILSSLGTWLCLLLLGGFLGCIYYDQVARHTGSSITAFNLRQVMRQFAQTIFLSLALLFVLSVFFIPAFVAVSLFSAINPSIGQFLVLGIGLFVVWLFVPLVFSPHGIFTSPQNAISAIFSSIRLVRFFLPGTGFFLLTSVLVNEGLNKLWTIPPASSWMLLLGIGGHAFIFTALFASSFIYYRGGLRWMHFNMEQAAAAASTVKA